MFFKQLFRNSAKSRKNNGLFFGALVIAIVAFYTLLSLGEQDVMRFLKTMEGDAVGKLMLLIPAVYLVSLFFVFFLVYFAYRYQLDSRKKEFGLYLMMGMRRSKLFAMLMGETLWNSLVSVLIGLPIALFLTEGISLATAKLVGLGIIGHKISFSLSAVLGTVAGFIIVQMAAMLFLCFEFSRKEPMQLLQTDSQDKQVSMSKSKGWLCFIFGLVFLIAAYGIGVLMLRSFDLVIVSLLLVFGIAGTFLIFRGMGVFIGLRIQQKSPSQSGLFTFTGRQIQENILYEHKALAISSLLLLMALSCLSFGIGSAAGSNAKSSRNVDFSIEGSEEDVTGFLHSAENEALVGTVYPMFLSQVDTDIHEFSWGLRTALETQAQTSLRDNMIENFRGQESYPYMISLRSYNHLLESIGKPPIKLDKRQAALYTSNRDNRELIDLLTGALGEDASVQIDGVRYALLPELCYENIVADRKIAFYSALIVPDEVYQSLASDNTGTPFCWNVRLREDVVHKNGLMQIIQTMEKSLTATGLNYESYLGGIGRNLFYTVAASYITIYLGILFLLIANTVMGLKFLMQQRTNKQRYLTLLMLGATPKALYLSAKKQIMLFFAFVFAVAACNSVFAVWSMFQSFMKLPAGTSMNGVLLLSVIGFALIVLLEFIYISIVKRANKREMQTLRVTDRR